MDYRKFVVPTGVGTTEAVIPDDTTVMRFLHTGTRICGRTSIRTSPSPTRTGGYSSTPTWLVGWPRSDAAAPAVQRLTQEVQQMLDVALDRDDRFAEIIDQHEAEGAISHFLGMLMIDPSRMPASNLLIRVARRIGEHVVMCLKGEFRCPRPSQLCTALVPMIDPPATPSFPAGHSLQAQLIAECLKATDPVARPVHLLDNLARRLGRTAPSRVTIPRTTLSAGVWRAGSTTLLGVLLADWKFKVLLNAASTELQHQWADAPTHA